MSMYLLPRFCISLLKYIINGILILLIPYHGLNNEDNLSIINIFFYYKIKF